MGGVPSQTATSSAQNDARQSHTADGKASRIRFDSVHTKEGVDALMNDKTFAEAHDTLRLVEVVMARGDAPKALLGQAAATQKSNRYEQ